MNPPFTAKSITAFLRKAHAELQAGHCRKIIAFLPAWVNKTTWFSKYCAYHHIMFIDGTVHCENTSGNAP